MRPMRRPMSWLLALGIAVLVANAWAAGGLIAVAAEAGTAEAPVSDVAARAPHILLFDADGELVASHPNPVAASPGGAGPALAAWLVEQRVTILIAGDFGAKLARALEERGIAAVVAAGPAGEAVQEANP